MRQLTSKIGDLLSHFDEIDESQAETENTSLKHLLINNHDLAANKSKIKRQLPLEYIFGVCQTFKKVTKQSSFHLTFKTTDIQDIFNTTLGDDIRVIFDNFLLIVPIIIPNGQTQLNFIDLYFISFDSWSTDSKTVDTQIEYQVDIGSAHRNNSPKCLIVAHQTADRIRVPNKARKIAVFDNFNVKKYHVDIDGIRYPRDSVSIHYASNDYLDDYRDLEIL